MSLHQHAAVPRRRVLLANPRFPVETFWSFDRALAVAGRDAVMPPLGLLTVAGLIPRDRYDVALADENLGPIRDEDLREADLVLATGMVVQQEALLELVARCRALGTKVCVGGPLVSACFDLLLERGFDPDVWFLGEAEQLFGEVLVDFESGALRRVYAHVPDAGHAVRVRMAFGSEARLLIEPRPALDRSPMPRFDLLELPRYHSMAIQASRGCPIGCEFCDIWVQFGRAPRTGSPARILAQLDELERLGWRGRVFVVDDNFIGNLSAARGLVPALVEWQESRGRPFAFSTEADCRLGDAGSKMTALREGLARAGFHSVFLGIETPSAASLQETGKRVNLSGDGEAADGLLARVARIQTAGIEVKSGFILGFDNDPEGIETAMVEFVQQAGIPIAMVGTLGVLPGTMLHERLVLEGRYRGELVGTQTHGFRLNFEPRGRTEGEVLDQYAHVLEELFGRGMGPYYRRCETLMERMPAPPETGDRLGWRGLRAFLGSLHLVRPRTSYLRFLLRTLLQRPRFFAYAVVLAVQGEHLHRLGAKAVGEYRRRSHRAELRGAGAPRASARLASHLSSSSRLASGF